MLDGDRTPQIRAALRKGEAAAAEGRSRSDNPYVDWRCANGHGVTYARGFRRAWFEGYDRRLRNGE